VPWKPEMSEWEQDKTLLIRCPLTLDLTSSHSPAGSSSRRSSHTRKRGWFVGFQLRCERRGAVNSGLFKAFRDLLIVWGFQSVTEIMNEHRLKMAEQKNGAWS